jgi:hypothetical protein
MKYRVSEKYLERKKIEPIFSSLWGLLLGCLVFAANENVTWYIATGVILFIIAIAGGSNWLGSQRIIESYKNHCLELKGNLLVLTDNAMCSEIDMNSIHRLIVDKKKDNVVSIFIERVKARKKSCHLMKTSMSWQKI